MCGISSLTKAVSPNDLQRREIIMAHFAAVHKHIDHRRNPPGAHRVVKQRCHANAFVFAARSAAMQVIHDRIPLVGVFCGVVAGRKVDVVSRIGIVGLAVKGTVLQQTRALFRDLIDPAKRWRCRFIARGLGWLIDSFENRLQRRVPELVTLLIEMHGILKQIGARLPVFSQDGRERVDEFQVVRLCAHLLDSCVGLADLVDHPAIAGESV